MVVDAKAPLVSVAIAAWAAWLRTRLRRLEARVDRAWTAALVLIILVMGLNVVARLISRFFAPTTGR